MKKQNIDPDLRKIINYFTDTVNNTQPTLSSKYNHILQTQMKMGKQ